MHYFSIFFEKFNKARVDVWTKKQFIGNSEKSLENVDKFSSQNCYNALFYHIF